ncbi:MAG: AmmeMemoRadiSam system radical SAM enzyme [Anaerolineae bacterium]|nr:AmmeMemoRadiSam system radical SAM enzyme [Anaerolineae bacterium]
MLNSYLEGGCDVRKEACLVRPLHDGAVQCLVCDHACAIRPGEVGKCGVRYNDAGTLYLMVYGRAVSINLDPVEKKPLFHFLPGGDILSIGTLGCNFRCAFCQNWNISQRHWADGHDARLGQVALPNDLVGTCLQRGVNMIAYTYNEPTVFFEYTYDTARLAHENGIRNVYVSNGFMSQQALEMIAPYLDGINVDLKAFSNDFYREQCGGRLEPVKRNIRTIARETDIWIEVTTLLIPGLNDSREELTAMANWLAEVDPDMPWHISAFHPDYQMTDRPPTPPASLQQAYQIGKDAGLRYVYVGNVMDQDRSSTFCPQCGELLVRRSWYAVQELWKKRGTCPQCDYEVAGVWT